MLYTISEFLTLLKEDIGIKDIPLPVDDVELLDRLKRSAMKEFSQRAPHQVDVVLTDDDRMRDPIMDDYYIRYLYRIPKRYYQDATIIDVVDFDIAKPTGYSDYYMPNTMMGSPLTVLESYADIQLAASMAAATSRAPSWRFVGPDILQVYNGWTQGKYIVRLAMTHDINLTTMSPTAMTHFRQLATLDLEAYLYNKLKRKDNLDLIIGSNNLKIDEWANSAEEMRNLLTKWDDEGANLDIDSASFY